MAALPPASAVRQPALELMNAERMRVAPLNVVCFRYVPEGWDDAATDGLNRAAVAAIPEDGRVFVTGTTWVERGALRAAFDNWATTKADVAALQTVVAEVGERLLREAGRRGVA